jgi:hypothetical protein
MYVYTYHENALTNINCDNRAQLLECHWDGLNCQQNFDAFQHWWLLSI